MADFSLDRLLGGLSPERFLAEYWQKKPLLVRQALPGFGGWLDRAGLSRLACRDDAESRLVQFQRKQCLLDHGPFEEADLDVLPRRGWSLLVSGVNHLLPEGDDLLHRFDFIPQARLDDLMVSFAPPGGGVGPHFDSYDVFLIQGQGRRRWEISGQDDLEVVEGAPLRILKRFRVDQSWELEPGDMLYLPPGWAHDGVALGECMTYSVGFRQPARGELARELLQRLADEASDALGDAPYRDPGQGATATPGAVPEAMLDFARAAVQRLAGDEDMLAMLLGEWLTEPKPDVWFEAAPDAGTDPARGLRLDRRTRMMYDGQHVFINGEGFRASGRDAELMCRLADAHVLPAAQRRRLSAPARGLLAEWLQAGWLHEHD